MVSQVPAQPDTPESMEGVAAHWIASEALLHGVFCKPGGIAPNGIAITEEMIEASETYVVHVRHTLRDVLRGQTFSLHVEERIECPTIHPTHCWGTPDLWAWRPVIATLDIWDFKYGHGFIDEYENRQLITYASGILDKTASDGYNETTVINMHVVQPRCYNSRGTVRTWTVTAAELRGYINELHMAAMRAFPIPPDSPGVDPVCTVNEGCKHCPASHACETLQQAALKVTDVSLSAIPFDLTSLQTGHELRWMHAAQAVLNARISGLEEQALAAIKRGERVPYYTVEHSESRLKWNRPESEIIALGKLFGKNLAKPLAAITPTQAMKLKIDEAVIMQYSNRTSGSAKLVPAVFRSK